MSGGRRLAALVTSLLLVGAVSWWLSDDGTEDRVATLLPGGAVGSGAGVAAGVAGSDLAGASHDPRSEDSVEAIDAPRSDEDGGGAPAVTTAPAELRGRVLRPDGAPVAGATIVLAWTVPELLRADRIARGIAPADGAEGPAIATTDALGRFAVATDLAAPGALAADGALLAARFSRTDLLVRRTAPIAPGPQDTGDLVLPRGAAVSGRSVDSNGAGIQDVHATANVEPRLPTRPRNHRDVPDDIRDAYWQLCYARSDEQGRFEIAGLQTGEAEVKLETRGWRRVVFRFGLAEHEEVDLGTVAMDTGEVLAGVVRDPAGAPLERVSVSARSRDAWDQESRADRELQGLQAGDGRTDAEGRFRISGLAKGTFDLSLKTRGRPYTHLQGIVAGVTDLELVISDGASILVEVRDAATNMPVPDAEVVARTPVAGKYQPWSDHDFATASGSEEGLAVGQYRVTGVGSFGAVVRVAAPGYAGRDVEAPGGAPGTEQRLEVTLRRGLVLHGRVLDLAEHPVPDADVRLLPRNVSGSTGARAVRSGADGGFRIDGLVKGLWDVTVTGPGWLPTPTRQVSIEADHAEELLVWLSPAARIEGTALGPDDETVPGTTVSALRIESLPLPVVPGAASPWTLSSAWDRDAAEVRVSLDGRYVLEGLGPGLFWVVAESEAVGADPVKELRAVLDVDAGTRASIPTPAARQRLAELGGREVVVTTGETAVADVLVPLPASLHGQILVGERPAAGGYAVLLDFDLEAERYVETRQMACDTDGRFVFADLAPARHVVVVSADGQAQPRVGFVDLAAGERRRLDFVLAGAAIEVMVRSTADGTPVEGVEVSIDADGLAPPPGFDPDRDVAIDRLANLFWWHEPVMMHRLLTDAAGRVRFEQLPPGRYWARASGGPWRHVRSTQVQLGHEDAEILASMDPAAVLWGAVGSAGGGLPARDTAIELIAPDGRRSAVDYLEAGDPTYRFEGIEPGTWELRVLDGAEVLASERVPLAAGDEIRRDLIVDG